jgi:uncharacterized membrane protein
MSWQKLAIVGLIILSLGLSLLLYGQLPERMASHWNAAGEVDGYMDKSWGAFLLPGVIAFLAVLYYIIPRIDPLGKNIERFKSHYEGFFVVLSLFFLLIHLQVLLWNTGTRISPNAVMPVGLGFLFFYIGILVENAKRNWFVGIRTPWTLSNEEVWDRTHELGGKLYKIAGVIALLGLLFQQYTIWFAIGPILLFSAYLFVYSYLEFRKLAKSG